MRKVSNSSTDSGNGSWTAFTGCSRAGVTTGAAGGFDVDEEVGAAPFVFGSSIVEDAISSSLDVAASSLWMIAVSSFRETVGTTLSSMIAVQQLIFDV